MSDTYPLHPAQPNGMGVDLLGAGAQVIDTAVGTYYDNKNVEKTIEANKDLSDAQFQHDIDMWNMGNAYNTPSEQMARLKAAGLNPNLVYGAGNVTGNQSGALPKYNAIRADYSKRKAPKLAPAIQTYQNLNQQGAQIDNIKEDTALKEEQKMGTILKNQGQIWDNGIKEVHLDNLKELARYTQQIQGQGALAFQDQKIRNAMQDGINKEIYGRNLSHQEDINKWRAGLRDQGVTDSDSFFMRWLASKGFFSKADAWSDNFKNNIVLPEFERNPDNWISPWSIKPKK